MADTEQMTRRKRAAKRSMNYKAGKPVDDGLTEEATPTVAETETPAEVMPTEGGIVAEAEAEATQQESEESQEPAAEEVAESPAEEMAEAETEGETPEAEAAEPAAEEMAETPEGEMAEAPAQSFTEYMAPEGPSHDELIDEYHDALAYGDLEKAKELYKQLQNHRYVENMHRTRLEGDVKKDMDEYVAAAQELSAKHPVLSEDGIEADKVMALAEIYRNNGDKPAQALRKAVADLFPEENTPEAPEAPAPTAMAEAEQPPVEAKAEEAAAPEAKAQEPVAEAPPGGAEAEGGQLPDMTARLERKAKLSVVPTASARNPAPPKEEPPSRSSAIAAMRKARGQA